MRTGTRETENRKPTEAKCQEMESGEVAPRGDKHSVAMAPSNHDLPFGDLRDAEAKRRTGRESASFTPSGRGEASVQFHVNKWSTDLASFIHAFIHSSPALETRSLPAYAGAEP